MKLRCVTNSIRLRVRKSDLEKLTDTGKVAESIGFPGGTSLEFMLSMSTSAVPDCTYQAHQVLVSIPTTVVQNWVNSNEVGLNYTFDLADGEQLNVLIEKDFPCNHSDADFEDTFFELVEGEQC
ncbi:MAG: hypothetical protein AAGI23_19405 [Bacteroidota bacterium]